jgi:hypothetical protein
VLVQLGSYPRAVTVGRAPYSFVSVIQKMGSYVGFIT